MATDKQANTIEVPEDWGDMSDEEQQAWVAAAIELIFS